MHLCLGAILWICDESNTYVAKPVRPSSLLNYNHLDEEQGYWPCYDRLRWAWRKIEGIWYLFFARICEGHWPYYDGLRWAWRKACWRHGGMRGTFARGPLRPPTRKTQTRIGWNESNERTMKAAEVFAFGDVNQRKIKLRSHYLHWCQWCDCSGACKHWLMIHLHSSYSFLGGPLRKVTNRSCQEVFLMFVYFVF